MSQDQQTMHDVLAKVIKKAGVDIKDKDLKDVLASYVSTSTSKK